MLNGELYAQRLQKLSYLHLFTDCFMTICSNDWREIFMKHSVNKCNKLTSVTSVALVLLNLH